MSNIRAVKAALKAAGLRFTRDDGLGGFQLHAVDLGIGGGRKYHKGQITLAIHVHDAWSMPEDRAIAAERAIADRTTAALVNAGLAPYGGAGWRKLILVDRVKTPRGWACIEAGPEGTSAEI